MLAIIQVTIEVALLLALLTLTLLIGLGAPTHERKCHECHVSRLV